MTKLLDQIEMEPAVRDAVEAALVGLTDAELRAATAGDAERLQPLFTAVGRLMAAQADIEKAVEIGSMPPKLIFALAGAIKDGVREVHRLKKAGAKAAKKAAKAAKKAAKAAKKAAPKSERKALKDNGKDAAKEQKRAIKARIKQAKAQARAIRADIKSAEKAEIAAIRAGRELPAIPV